MFSGIIEDVGSLKKIDWKGKSARIFIQRPSIFNDIKIGDSISCNGICLTIEEFDDYEIQFLLGPETMKVLGWYEPSQIFESFNLERSLIFGGRIHGHLVTGHIDGLGLVLERKGIEDCVSLKIKIPDQLLPFMWRKGSVALNGVSLTLNEVDLSAGIVEVCLIPETLKRTNLSNFEEGAFLGVEADFYAKGLLQLRNFSAVRPFEKMGGEILEV